MSWTMWHVCGYGFDVSSAGDAKLLAFIKIRNALSGFPFGNRLPCDAKLFCNILLSHL